MRKCSQQTNTMGPNRGRTRFRVASAFLGILVFLIASVASAASFTASLDRDTVAVGDNMTLTLSVEGDQPDSFPALPTIPNLQITSGVQSQSFSLVNGRQSVTFSKSYLLSPTQPGDYTIPALKTRVGERVLMSEPLRFKAVKADSPAGNGSEERLAFARILLPGKQIYIGQTVVGQLELYIREGVQGAHDLRFDPIPAPGFNVGKMVQGQQRRVQVGNAMFTQVPWTFTLTPVKAGPLSVGPIAGRLVVDLASTRRRDPLWDPFGWGSTEQRNLSLATEMENVQALSLPTEGAPPNFNGAIGSFTMTVNAGPTNVAVGDPVTVKIEIAGTGALDSLSLPEQPAWHDFKIYPSTPRIESDQLGFKGVKTFEEVLVPQNADIKALPPVSFSYFDSESKTYRTLTGAEVALAVRPSGAAAVPVVAAGNRGAQDNAPPARDIVAIKQRLGEVAEIAPPLVQQSWFVALQSVPALAFFGCVFWRRRGEQLAHNPRLRRRRQVAQCIREGRSDLRRFAAENSPDHFFATLFRLLQEQLGERLDLPASAITEAVIEERLRPGGVPEPTLVALRELFQNCNLARYAPIKTSQELAALIPKIETVLNELQEVKG